MKILMEICFQLWKSRKIWKNLEQKTLYINQEKYLDQIFHKIFQKKKKTIFL